MAWFRRQSSTLAAKPAESRVPEGVWVKCGSCKDILYRRDVLKNLSVCPKCAFHFRIAARERLDMLFDGTWEEFDAGLVSADPLGFDGPAALRRAAPSGKGQDERLRRPGVRSRGDRRPANDRGSDGVRLHRRLDGRASWARR